MIPNPDINYDNRYRYQDDLLARAIHDYFIQPGAADAKAESWVENSFIKLVAHLEIPATLMGFDNPFENIILDPNTGERPFHPVLIEGFLRVVVKKTFKDFPMPAASPVSGKDKEDVPLLQADDEAFDHADAPVLSEAAYVQSVHGIIEEVFAPRSPLAPNISPRKSRSRSPQRQIEPPEDREIQPERSESSVVLDRELMDAADKFIHDARKIDLGGKITGPGETIFLGGMKVLSTVNAAKNLADLNRDTSQDKSSISDATQIASMIFSGCLFVMYLAEWVIAFHAGCKNGTIKDKDGEDIKLSIFKPREYCKHLWSYIKKQSSPDVVKEFMLGIAYFSLGIVAMTVALAAMPLSFVFAGIGLFDSVWDLTQNIRRRIRVATKKKELTLEEAWVNAFSLKTDKQLEVELETFKHAKPASSKVTDEILWHKMSLCQSRLYLSHLEKMKAAEEAKGLPDFTRINGLKNLIDDGKQSLDRTYYKLKKAIAIRGLSLNIKSFRRESGFALFRQITRTVLSLAGIAAAVLTVFFPPAGLIMLATITFLGMALFIAHTIHRNWMGGQMKTMQMHLLHKDNPLHKDDHTPAPQQRWGSTANIKVSVKTTTSVTTRLDSEPAYDRIADGNNVDRKDIELTQIDSKPRREVIKSNVVPIGGTSMASSQLFATNPDTHNITHKTASASAPVTSSSALFAFK